MIIIKIVLKIYNEDNCTLMELIIIICHIDSKYEIAPPTNTWNWTKINSSK